METSDFYTYLSKYPKVLDLLDGIYSIDNIPNTIKQNHFIICNSDVSIGRGLHWFCLYRANNNLIECFDSLGINETIKKEKLITACNFRNIKALRINNTQIQSDSTDTCGKFCLMYIVERLYNPDLSFDELLNSIFTDDCSLNEIIVQNFFTDFFG